MTIIHHHMISTTHTQLERERGWKKKGKKEGEEMKGVREEVGSVGKQGGSREEQEIYKDIVKAENTTDIRHTYTYDQLSSPTPEVTMSTH